MTEQALNWGETNGEAISNKVTYMKFNEGTNTIRIVGNILRRYIYWLENVKGAKLPFENLDFSRETEKFMNTGLNPVKELGLQSRDYYGNLEFNKDGSPKPLGSKKAYLVPVINRASNAVEYMELKKGIFDGINEVMAKLNDPKQIKKFVDTDYRVKNPMFVDIIFTKSGKGKDTEYKVDLLDVMELVQDDDEFEAMMKQHQADEALLKDLRPIDEVFPRQSYSEQKEALEAFMNPSTDDADEEQDPKANEAANEAMNELD